MFCIEGLKAAGQCARAVCACLCCLICAGPILLIVGLVLLVSPNNRQDRVDEYNKAVKAYEAPGWKSNMGTIGGAAVKAQSTAVEVKGNKDGVDDATSTVVFATVSERPTTVQYQVDKVESFSRTPSYTTTQSRTMRCSHERGCSARDMQSSCRGTYRGSGCSRSGSCGTCEMTEYLSTYCAVVKKTADGKYEEDGSKSSCFYPFKGGDQEYSSSSSSSVTFQLRASDDPFIALQRITKGDRDFGISAKQQRLTGLVLIIIGAILIACICLVGFFAYRLISAALGKKNESATHTVGAGGTVNVVNSNTSNAVVNNDYPPPQPAYPQPGYQQPYPQQQQPYYPPPQQQQYPPAQPQPAYGYGQPPPAGQPNYGY